LNPPAEAISEKKMEDTIRRLIDAEMKAESMVSEADAERERLMHQALADARAMLKKFEERIPELRASFMKKEEERAAQAVGELERRYRERRGQLSKLAEERREEAIEAALALLCDPMRS
jgi:V/A-type H+-transporting ATPase subunit G/H